MHRLALTTATLLLLTGCAAPTAVPAAAPAPTVTVTQTVTQTATPPPAPAPTPASVTAAEVKAPNLVGGSLAAAYVALDDLGIPDDKRNAHDVTGAGRTVLNPSNWQVCTQTPKAGTPVKAGVVWEFGVAKFGEGCK